MPDHTVTLRERLKYLGLAVLTVFNTYVCASLVALALASLSDHQLVFATVPLLCGTVFVTVLTVAFLPRASWRRVGLGPGAGRGVPLGLVMGLLGCGALVLVVSSLGWARWVPIEAEALRFDLRATPVQGLALLAVGATGEELFARGLLLQCLARALGPAGAIVLTSAGFARAARSESRHYGLVDVQHCAVRCRLRCCGCSAAVSVAGHRPAFRLERCAGCAWCEHLRHYNKAE